MVRSDWGRETDEFHDGPNGRDDGDGTEIISDQGTLPNDSLDGTRGIFSTKRRASLDTMADQTEMVRRQSKRLEADVPERCNRMVATLTVTGTAKQR